MTAPFGSSAPVRRRTFPGAAARLAGDTGSPAAYAPAFDPDRAAAGTAGYGEAGYDEAGPAAYGVAAAAEAGETFSRCADVTSCPRCAGETYRRPQCPTCALVLSDAVLEQAEKATQQQATRRTILSLGLFFGLAMGFAGLVVGDAHGRRSVAVAATTAETATASQTQAVLRGLDDNARYQLHAAQIRQLFGNRDIMPITRVKFGRRAIPQQAMPAGIADVTLEVASDAAWRTLTPDEKLMLIAGLAQSHAEFLGLIQAPDTSHFAAVISVRDAAPGGVGEGAERVLALRDRTGALRTR